MSDPKAKSGGAAGFEAPYRVGSYPRTSADDAASRLALQHALQRLSEAGAIAALPPGVEIQVVRPSDAAIAIS